MVRTSRHARACAHARASAGMRGPTLARTRLRASVLAYGKYGEYVHAMRVKYR